VVQLAVSGDAGRADAGVENTGLIDAGGGRVVLTAGTASGLLSNVINTSGVIRAASADGAGGTIELLGRGGGTVRVAGNLDASGATRGGSVTVTGQDVRLAPTARVAASGRAAGGSVRIGGDRLGQGELRRAETATVDEGARIEARATEGTGGSVILWADQDTWFAGAIAADGPAAGGFVETSAREHLGIAPSAEVTPGPGGLWLLDPRNVVISTATSGATVGAGVHNPPPGPGDWVVHRGPIQTALNNGGDVTITTAAPTPTPGAAGNITVSASITWSGAGSLTLDAHNDIIVNAAIATSGAGSFTANAQRDTIVNHNVTATGTGGVTLRGVTGDVIVTNATSGNREVRTASGELTMEAGRSVLLRRPLEGSGNVRVFSASGPVTLTGGTSVELTGGSTTSAWVRLGTATSSSAVTVTAPTIRVAGGTVAAAFAEILAGASGGITGAITLAASERIDVVNNAGPGRVLARVGAPLTMRAPEQIWNGRVEAGTSTTGNGGEVRLAGNITAGVPPIFNLAPGNNFTLEAASSYTSPVALRVDTRGAGTITLNGPVTAAGVRLESQERVTLAPGATVTATGGALTMRAPVQIWDGRVVAAGTAGEPTGGEVRLAGGITATVAPVFNLGPGNSFTLEPTAPGPPGVAPTPSRYISPVALRVDTRGAGAITLHAPVTAAGATLVSERRVTLASGATVTATGPGDALVIAAGRRFDNQAGEAALAAPEGGRWLVFLDRFGDMRGTEPAPAAFDLYHRQFNYADPQRSDVAAQIETLGVLAGNRIVYGQQPVITVTGQSLAKTYGTAVTPAATVAGLRPKDALADILAGGTAATSDGAAAGANVGSYPTTPIASLTGRGAEQRYLLALVNGTLTVNPAPLTVTANDAVRFYGSPNPAFTARFDGFVLGQDASVLGGTLAFATPATPASPVGAYTVMPGGLTSGNYAITFRPGTLTVHPAPLTVTANDAARFYGMPNPPFSASFAGFVLGQGPGVLGGALAFATPATAASPAGHYAIVPSGLTSGNYAITFAPGTLAVLAPVTLPPLELRPLTVNGMPALHPGDAGLRIGAAAFEAVMAVVEPLRWDDDQRERE
jgi:hypothetical protein